MNETKVNLIVGSSKIRATLNNTVSAMDLISKLPYSVRVSRSPVDYCGVLSEPLKSDRAEGQPGWKNGDISYIPGDDYIAFFFDGEADSSSSGYTQHIIGKVDDPAGLGAWPPGSVEVRMERI
jgi:hypothetical protein